MANATLAVAVVIAASGLGGLVGQAYWLTRPHGVPPVWLSTIRYTREMRPVYRSAAWLAVIAGLATAGWLAATYGAASLAQTPWLAAHVVLGVATSVLLVRVSWWSDLRYRRVDRRVLYLAAALMAVTSAGCWAMGEVPVSVEAMLARTIGPMLVGWVFVQTGLWGQSDHRTLVWLAFTAAPLWATHLYLVYMAGLLVMTLGWMLVAWWAGRSCRSVPYVPLMVIPALGVFGLVL